MDNKKRKKDTELQEEREEGEIINTNTITSKNNKLKDSKKKKTLSSSPNNVWKLWIKFKERRYHLIGKLPREKCNLINDLPKSLDIHTKAKLSIIPQGGYFCKYIMTADNEKELLSSSHKSQVQKNLTPLKEYLVNRQTAICTDFTCGIEQYTLYILHPSMVSNIKCYQRLKKAGMDVKSLTKDHQDVIVGVLSHTQLNPQQLNIPNEFEKEKKQNVIPNVEKVQTLVEALLPSSFVDPMLELELLLYNLRGSQSGIEACSRWVLEHPECSSNTWSKIKLCLQDSKSMTFKVNILYLIHDVLRKLRGSTNMLLQSIIESNQIQQMLQVLPILLTIFSHSKTHKKICDGLMQKWNRWGIQMDNFIMKSKKMMGEYESAWIIPLTRCHESHFEALDNAMNWALGFGCIDQDIDKFLRRYIHRCYPYMLSISSLSKVAIDTGEYSILNGLRESFIVAWNLDQRVSELVYKEDEVVIEDVWKRVKFKQMKLGSAIPFPYVLSTMRKVRERINSSNYTPDERMFQLQKEVDEMDKHGILNKVLVIWKLDEKAHQYLFGLSIDKIRKIVKELCEISSQTYLPNPSQITMSLIRKFCPPSERKSRWYSPKMKYLMEKALGRRISATNVMNSNENKESEKLLTDEELEALKATIPPPPALLFKKIDMNTIIFKETNGGGTLAVAPSGIPGAGRGLFNISGNPWPAFSVVCIFGSRRITKEMHHDGLNKVCHCGELGETFVVVNEKVMEVEEFKQRYQHRLLPYDGLVDAEGSVGGFPNDRVYEYPEEIYWDASGFYNNTVIVSGCFIDPRKPDSKIILDQLYLITWKEVLDKEEFFLAYGTSYYEEDEKGREKKIE